MRGADGDDEVRVSRIGDADAVVRLARRSLLGCVLAIALIAGRGDDDHPGRDHALAFVADGRASAGVVGDVVRNGEAEVDAVHGEIVVRGVEVADELQRGHDREFIAAAGGVEHAQVVELEVGTDADQIAGGVVARLVGAPVAGHDPAHVRAVIEGRRDVGVVVRDAQQRRDDFPIDRPAVAQTFVQFIDRGADLVRDFGIGEQFLDAVGLVVGDRIEHPQGA